MLEPTPPDSSDRRAMVRFPCRADAVCRFQLPTAEDLQEGKVCDLSASGVGLILRRRFSPGSVLELTLENPGRNFCRTLLAAVRRAAAQESDSWVIGCAFLHPLTNRELAALLASV